MELDIRALFDGYEDEGVPIRERAEVSPEKIREVVMERIERTKHRPARRLGSILLVAAVFVLLLTATAFAIGVLPEIFERSEALGRIPEAGDRETAIELADTEERVAELPEFRDSCLTVSESYYDGEHLMLGYRLDVSKAPADFSFGPDSAYFDRLEPTVKEDTALMLDLRDYLTPEEYAEFQRILREKGAAGVRFEDVYLSDGIELPDGSRVGAPLTEETDAGYYLVFQYLNDAAKDKDALELIFRLKCVPVYYYQEGQTAYVYFDHDNTEIAELGPFTIPRAED